MDNTDAMSLTLAWLPVVVAGIATVIAWLGVRAAKDQVKIQRQLARDAAQPYVWADVRGGVDSGQMIQLVVGNSGPTIATNVRVKFDPPLPVVREMPSKNDTTRRGMDKLEHGIQSIAPGKTLRWHLGVAHKLFASDDSPALQPHAVTIEADGPFGALPTLEYVIDLSDFRETGVWSEGSLNQVAQAVTKGMDGIKREMQQRED
ncbi:hypothetical protein [Serinicoccus sp. LYQ131]|uniref:hypothetical protein n=1 Tax=Serinicoccus sp. LYQ131 TaxID=3378797 RepID=UPI00385377C0